MYTVYALVDPRTDEVRYIGITTDPEKRISDHMSPYMHYYPNERKMQWIHELRQAKLRAILRPLENAPTREKARVSEKFWITFYRGYGVDLLNNGTK